MTGIGVNVFLAILTYFGCIFVVTGYMIKVTQ
jgi:hypothetical protein